jgi:hypothetical protein
MDLYKHSPHEPKLNGLVHFLFSLVTGTAENRKLGFNEITALTTP